mgnify:CR=1 FL=1
MRRGYYDDERGVPAITLLYFYRNNLKPIKISCSLFLCNEKLRDT